MTDHLELWHSVERTDPSQVKPITGKPYKGTSPKPYYLVQKATEKFGPIGIGWGFEIVNERVEDGAVGDKVHIAHIRVWYKWGGEKGVVEHVGQTMFSGKNKNGPFTDEDAPKKSVTDALVKALSMIGFAGDIFMGRYDDSKYVNELREEAREHERETKRADDPALAYICKAKSDIQCYETAGELKAWWEQSAKERERQGVVKGTKAFDELWVLFCSTGKTISSKRDAA
jgi:hypothetical protein